MLVLHTVLLFAAVVATPGLLLSHDDAGDVQTRLHVITVTGLKRLDLAARMHAECARWLGPNDTTVTICDPSCTDAAKGQVGDVVEMDSSAFPNGTCVHHTGAACSEYERAQVKFVFGLVHEVRRLIATGGPFPQWFLVKDDDTYVHSSSLMQYANGYEKFMVSLATGLEGKTPMAGGGGWLLSGVLAREFAGNRGDELISLIANGIVDKVESTYDDYIPDFVRHVPGAVHRIFEPMNAECGWWSLNCTRPGEVSWHMREQVKDKSLNTLASAIKALDRCVEVHGI